MNVFSFSLCFSEVHDLILILRFSVWSFVIDLALLLHLIVISLSFILMSLTIYCFIELIVSEDKLLFKFYRHFKSTPFHTVRLFMFISFRTISYFSSSSHCFYGATNY
jgi:hypothetical protein